MGGPRRGRGALAIRCRRSEGDLGELSFAVLFPKPSLASAHRMFSFYPKIDIDEATVTKRSEMAMYPGMESMERIFVDISKKNKTVSVTLEQGSLRWD